MKIKSIPYSSPSDSILFTLPLFPSPSPIPKHNKYS